MRNLLHCLPQSPKNPDIDSQSREDRDRQVRQDKKKASLILNNLLIDLERRKSINQTNQVSIQRGG